LTTVGLVIHSLSDGAAMGSTFYFSEIRNQIALASNEEEELEEGLCG